MDMDGPQVPAQGGQEGAEGQGDDEGTFMTIINISLTEKLM
jgi:hypothetical protein